MINSLPHNDVRKRADDVGKYTQCPGTFPITVIEDTYTPAIMVPDQNITEHVIWDSTVEVLPTTIFTLTVTDLNGALKFSYQENFCTSSHKPLNIECPIPAGHLDYKAQYAVLSSPDQPKAQTVETLAKITLTSLDGTILMCKEGKTSVAFP
ncbi:17958_t:CDS:2 [Entrophospora sp. SA101]|nr:8699_t:CDS:2 [Entrophospora sp. SA101]CAJ0837834.1 7516_t:CDS:2 [Entrophospora sp. SA101]CAJ0843255.1 17958_t:CDS:2 [Entrophospora sp. SA101]